MSDLMPGYKTRVYKFGHGWRVSYYLPYSGLMLGDFSSWRSALDEAFAIEDMKAYI